MKTNNPETITEDKYYEMLEILPPENWQALPYGGEYFQMCEYYSGSLTNYYVKKPEGYFTFLGEAWLEPRDVELIIGGLYV